MFVRRKRIFEASLMVLSVGLFATFSTILFGQSPPAKPGPKKKFGHSLKRFEKKPEVKASALSSVSLPVLPDDDIIRVETNLVVTDVLVLNEKGNAIVGLGKGDFVIRENGVPQKLELFSPGADAKIPKSIVFIVEVGIIPAMADRSLEAAKKLVDRLNPNDRMAIVNTNIQLVQGFTSDKKLLKATLQALKAEMMGGRHNYSSLIAALLELFDQGELKPIVVNQNYGDELAALKPMWEMGKTRCERGVRGMCERAYSFSDLMGVIERSRATIYNVVPGPPFIGRSKEQQIKQARMFITGYGDATGASLHMTEAEKESFRRRFTELEISNHVEMQKALIRISTLSGGLTNFLEKPEDADAIYGDIFTMIESRYTIGYYPKNEARDGKRRSVTIEVKGHPEYNVVGRKTYLAQ